MKISVIVPVYQTWHLVPGMVQRLRNQTFDSSHFEVIFVDNGEIAIDEASRPAGCVFAHCEKPGSYAARNCGAEVAAGEVFVFTDSDCLPEPDWLVSLVDGIGDNELRAGRVAIYTSEKPNCVERYDRVKGIPQPHYVSRGYAATANLGVPARLFRAVEGFDESRFSGGDADFCRRAVHYGASLTYVEKAIVNHPARSSWYEIVTKARRGTGGQIASGGKIRRALWVARTLFPPLIEWWRIGTARDCSLGDKPIALSIESLLWLIRLLEIIRLILGFRPERR